MPASASTFSKWREAEERLDLHGNGVGEPLDPPLGEAPVAVSDAAPRRSLHDVLLGTTAVLLVGLLGGVGTFLWTHDAPGAVARATGG